MALLRESFDEWLAESFGPVQSMASHTINPWNKSHTRRCSTTMKHLKVEASGVSGH